MKRNNWSLRFCMIFRKKLWIVSVTGRLLQAPSWVRRDGNTKIDLISLFWVTNFGFDLYLEKLGDFKCYGNYFTTPMLIISFDSFALFTCEVWRVLIRSEEFDTNLWIDSSKMRVKFKKKSPQILMKVCFEGPDLIL